MYQGPFIYQNDSLQFIAHEEGRARWAYHKYTTGASAYGFEYDFFEKDHLGNTRVVLSQQKDTAKYLASGEAAYRTTEAQLFDNLTTTAVARSTAPGYPNDLTVTNPNDTVFKVNGNIGGHKMGPSLLLKVMSGDKIDLGVQEYYNSGSTGTTNTSLADVLASLATGVVNMTSGGKGSLADLNNTGASPIYAALNSFLPAKDTLPVGKPKAYLNWILLDEQLKYVNSYPQSGAITVGAAGTLNSLGYTGIPITKSGYLYIWVSNETPNWDVFFDNLAVKHYTGPLLEETHFYPFGLAMAGISSKALKPYYAENKYKYNNGSEFQNKEFSDGSGLEMYDTHFRQLDPQIGRWWQIDPMADAAYGSSPFAYANNNPLTFNDGLLSVRANPQVLEPVIVTAKKVVPKEFQGYITFPHGRNGSIASDNDWPLAWSRKNDLFYNWYDGTGAENRIYLPKHPTTRRLTNARAVNKARAYFYKKYLNDYKIGPSLKGASVTNIKGDFGFIGVISAGLDIVEQFVGSMNIDIHVDEKGENLLFVISNTTSETSAFYHLADSHEREWGDTEMGNLNQVYIFKEPITGSGFNEADLESK